MDFLERKTIFVALFLSLITLAGMNHFTTDVDAATDPNSTLPPPGGTLPPNAAGLQLLHLAPFGTNSDVNASISGANASTTYNNLGLGESTGAYWAVTAGSVNGSVTPVAGGTPLTFSETLDPNIEYTTAVIGGANGWPIEFLTLADTTAAPPTLFGKVRVVHVAPFAPGPAVNTAVNLVDQLGNSIKGDVFEGLVYKQSTDYVELPVGIYDWKVNLAINDSMVVDLPPFNLYNGAVATLYILGDGIVQPAAGLYTIHKLGSEPTFMYFAVHIKN